MIKVVIADDHPIIIDGLITVIKEDPDLQLIGQVNDGIELLSFLDKHEVDVIMLDVNMPKLNGIDAAIKIKNKYKNIQILTFSQYSERRFVKRMLKNGATGYMLKNSNAKEIIKGIKTVAEGRLFLSKELNNVFSSGRPKTQYTALFPDLSSRELEVLKLITDGLNTPQIAEKLNLSFHTIESHRSNLLLKVGVKNSISLVKWAIENDIV
jgi:DNA-binding NarL/FixJ family response regulator